MVVEDLLLERLLAVAVILHLILHVLQVPVVIILVVVLAVNVVAIRATTILVPLADPEVTRGIIDEIHHEIVLEGIIDM